MASGRIKRVRGGAFAVRLPAAERALLRAIPGQLRELLTLGATEDPVMKRLFPSAYLDDPEAAEEFDGFVHDDLLEQRMAALDTMERTIDARRLTEDELTAWLAAINDFRLVLGVRLRVSEESVPADFGADEATAGSFSVYGYLSYLEEDLVEALSSSG